ncbi:hypothetical protein [Glutamicibacter sp. V16R2B1]|uniref:hypothetical protein n=1 Tax=Glutamicibacter sp. V16R2B1 TaxID=2036207 RepID=UPI0010FEC7F2|nr:hypothetical protein [Glutamicibacter sp. V16R2B1]MCK9901323.1 hypothetical protein [Frankia sp. Cpl3]TLK47694.1 hypothetical protein FDN03_15710 [Glutamicibacter sp. V16R2B1]
MATEPTALPGMPDAPPDYAPFTWPTDERQVTADRLAQYLTASAMHDLHTYRDAITRANKNDPDGLAIYMNHTNALLARFAEITLLRTYQTTNPAAAEEVALDIWNAFEDGSTIHELLWDWAVEYGLPFDKKTGEVLLDADAA